MLRHHQEWEEQRGKSMGPRYILHAESQIWCLAPYDLLNITRSDPEIIAVSSPRAP